LTLRLIVVVGKVINPFETAFIPSRNILEGVVIVQEVLHELRGTKSAGVIIKLDFEKAYDKVNWNFLEEVLSRKGFADTWIQWISKAVRGGRVYIDLNGGREESSLEAIKASNKGILYPHYC
jgi:hypothetical protein